MTRPLSPQLVEQIERELRPKMVRLIREAVGTPQGTGLPAPTNVGVHSYGMHTGEIPSEHAPQFLLTSGARPLQGSLAVVAGATIDGVDLSEHVLNPNAHHAKQHSIIDADHHTAGGGGQYQVLWQAGTTGQLGWAQSSDDTAAGGVRILRSTAQGGLTLYRLAAALEVQTPKVYSTGNLTLSPAGGEVFMDTGVRVGTANYASQVTGWRITHEGAADFRYLYTDELHAKAFIADLEQALAGGQIIAKSVAVLAYDFPAPAAGGTASLYLEDLPTAPNMQVFQAGDTVRLRTFSRANGGLTIADCWGTVSAPSVDTGPSGPEDGVQRWTFTRSTGAKAGAMGAGAPVPAGGLALDYGAPGQGIWEVNAVDGNYTTGFNSPYAQVVTWTEDATTRAFVVRVRMGKLSGLADGQPTEYGLYVGTGGMTNADTYVRLSTYANRLNNIDSTWYIGGTKAVEISSTGGITVYAPSGNYLTTRAYSFATLAQDLGGVESYYDASSVSNRLHARAIGTAPVAKAILGATATGAAASVEVVADQNGGTTAGQVYVRGQFFQVDPQALFMGLVNANAGLYVNGNAEVAGGTLTVSSHVSSGGTLSVAGGAVAASYSTANWGSFNGGLITLQYASAPYHGVSIRANTGSAWARSFGFNDGANNLGGFGAYGPSGGLEHWYIGPSYGPSAHVFVRRSDGYVAVGNSTPQDRLHISGAVIAQAYRATVDTPGALTTGVAMTGAYQGVSTGTGTVKMGAGTNRNSDYWLKFYAGGAAVFVPAWSNIS